MKSLDDLIARFRSEYDAMLTTAQAISRIIEVEAGGPAGTHSKRLAMIQRTVADHYELPIECMSSKIRTREYAECRHVAMFLCRELTRFSLDDIASSFRPGMDHNTVMHGISTTADRISTSPEMRQTIQKLREQCARGIQDLNMPLFAYARTKTEVAA